MFRLTLVVVLALTLAANADDKKWENKAKAALALSAGHDKQTTAAPAPRPVKEKTYADASAEALAERLPLLVFVACEPVKVDGAISSKFDGKTFGHVAGPAVAVCYPVGKTLMIDGSLKCPATKSELESAVLKVSSKIGKPMPEKSKAPTVGEYKIATEGPCFQVWWAKGGGSATCVACEDGKSLLLTNNHVFSEVKENGQFVRADYPIRVTVGTLDGKKAYSGVAVDGVPGYDGDLAAVVVLGELIPAVIADKDPPVGSKVRHLGIGSNGSIGEVLQPEDSGSFTSWNFKSTLSSLPGDSGAGVFYNDMLIAVTSGNCSTDYRGPLCGAPLGAVKSFLQKRPARLLFHRAGKAGFNPPGVIPQKPTTQSCPNGKCYVR